MKLDRNLPYQESSPGVGPRGEKFKQGSRWFNVFGDFLYDEAAPEPEVVVPLEPAKRRPGRPRKKK